MTDTDARPTEPLRPGMRTDLGTVVRVRKGEQVYLDVANRQQRRAWTLAARKRAKQGR